MSHLPYTYLYLLTMHDPITKESHFSKTKLPTMVICTDLSGKELPRQAVVGTVVTSRNLGGVMGSTVAQNARVL